MAIGARRRAAQANPGADRSFELQAAARGASLGFAAPKIAGFRTLRYRAGRRLGPVADLSGARWLLRHLGSDEREAVVVKI
jgi:hypothetical protein